MRIKTVLALFCVLGALACGSTPKPLVPVDSALRTWEPSYQEPEAEPEEASTENPE